MKDEKKFDNFFDERNKYFLLFNLRQVIYIPSFRTVIMLCSKAHFSAIEFTDAKIKYRFSYLMNVSWLYLQNHLRMCFGRLRGLSSGCR